jgi:hypothetical protein
MCLTKLRWRLASLLAEVFDKVGWLIKSQIKSDFLDAFYWYAQEVS